MTRVGKLIAILSTLVILIPIFIRTGSSQDLRPLATQNNLDPRRSLSCTVTTMMTYLRFITAVIRRLDGGFKFALYYG
ncbi:MAG: hypothetical protein Q8P49_03500 [Candidatus Liptonbacteria bacterium]|nr:hypothetical protein [Candidatus Liptonbacteria bacterium]